MRILFGLFNIIVPRVKTDSRTLVNEQTTLMKGLIHGLGKTEAQLELRIAQYDLTGWCMHSEITSAMDNG